MIQARRLFDTTPGTKSMKEEVYISVYQCAKTEGTSVRVKDVASVWCNNATVKSKINTLKLYDFSGKPGNRVILTSIKIIEEITKNVQDVNVNPIGETDVIVEMNTCKKKNKAYEYTKVALICLIIFFGSGFSIMAFNNDVNVPEVFSQVYEYTMGEENDGFTIIEVMYSIGLALGILIFYDHFGKRKLDKDPTPIEVEMRQYEMQINSTMIEGVKRKEEHIDVD